MQWTKSRVRTERQQRQWIALKNRFAVQNEPFRLYSAHFNSERDFINLWSRIFDRLLKKIFWELISVACVLTRTDASTITWFAADLGKTYLYIIPRDHFRIKLFLEDDMQNELFKWFKTCKAFFSWLLNSFATLSKFWISLLTYQNTCNSELAESNFCPQSNSACPPLQKKRSHKAWVGRK